jgi:hypothetical protein
MKFSVLISPSAISQSVMWGTYLCSPGLYEAKSNTNMCFIQTIFIVVNMKPKPTTTITNSSSSSSSTFISLQHFTSSQRYLL